MPRMRPGPARVSGKWPVPVWVLAISLCLDPVTGPLVQLWGPEWVQCCLAEGGLCLKSAKAGTAPMGSLPVRGGPCTSVCALMSLQSLGSNPFLLRCLLAGSHCLSCLGVSLSPAPGRDASDLRLPSGCKARILTARHIPGPPDGDQCQCCRTCEWDNEGSEGLVSTWAVAGQGVFRNQVCHAFSSAP